MRRVDSTRRGDRFLLGASPRAAIGLLAAARAHAVVHGRDFCLPDDVKELAVPVLAHRMVPLARNGQVGGQTEHELEEILDSIPVPN